MNKNNKNYNMDKCNYLWCNCFIWFVRWVLILNYFIYDKKVKSFIEDYPIPVKKDPKNIL